MVYGIVLPTWKTHYWPLLTILNRHSPFLWDRSIPFFPWNSSLNPLIIFLTIIPKCRVSSSSWGYHKKKMDGFWKSRENPICQWMITGDSPHDSGNPARSDHSEGVGRRPGMALGGSAASPLSACSAAAGTGEDVVGIGREPWCLRAMEVKGLTSIFTETFQTKPLRNTRN